MLKFFADRKTDNRLGKNYMPPIYQCWGHKKHIEIRLSFFKNRVFENTVGKGEIAPNEQFLLFPQFSTLSNYLYLYLSTFLTSYLYLLLNWKNLKLAYQVKA